MKVMSLFLFAVLLASLTAQLAAQDSKAPPESEHDFLQLIASKNDLGRPYSDTPGGDLRIVVPTLRDRRLELPCVLASVNALLMEPRDNETRLYPFEVELLLLGGDKTWALVSFNGLHPERCHSDSYRRMIKGLK